MSGELRAATGKGSKEIKDPPGRPRVTARAMASRLREGEALDSLAAGRGACPRGSHQDLVHIIAHGISTALGH